MMPIRGTCSQRIKITELRDKKISFQEKSPPPSKRGISLLQISTNRSKDNPKILTEGKYNQPTPLSQNQPSPKYPSFTYQTLKENTPKQKYH